MKKTVTIQTISPESIAELLKEQHANIPQDVDNQIHGWLNVKSKMIPKKLLTAINCFDTPEQGFQIWKEYYQTGDRTKLIEEFKKQKFTRKDLYKMMTNLIEEEQLKKGEKINSLSNRFKRFSISNFSTLILKLITRQGSNEGLDTNQMAAYGIMEETRDIVDSTAKYNALQELLKPYLADVIEKNMASSLDALQNAQNKQLFDENVFWSIRDEAAKINMQDLTKLAEQSFEPNQQSRHILNLKTTQIPQGTKFGFEVEGFIPTKTETMKTILTLSRALVTVGLPTNLLSLGGAKKNYSKWSVTYDTSIKNPLYFTNRENTEQATKHGLGIEFISRVLDGPNGGTEAAIALDLISKIHFKTNESCGMHLHCDISNNSVDEVKNLVTAYVRNEDTIDEFIDPDRRDNRNTYAKSLKHIDINELDKTTTLQEIVNIVNPNGDRNFKFDITRLNMPKAPQTVQYRGEGGAGYLEGTMSYIVFMTNFTQQALKNPNITVNQVLKSLDHPPVEIPNPIEETKPQNFSR